MEAARDCVDRLSGAGDRAVTLTGGEGAQTHVRVAVTIRTNGWVGPHVHYLRYSVIGNHVIHISKLL
jgi:hypothetical protein